MEVPPRTAAVISTFTTTMGSKRIAVRRQLLAGLLALLAEVKCPTKYMSKKREMKLTFALCHVLSMLTYTQGAAACLVKSSKPRPGDRGQRPASLECAQ